MSFIINWYTTNIHYKAKSQSNKLSKTYDHNPLQPDVWYTASALWTPSKIELYLNNVLIREVPASDLNIPVDSLASMNIWVDINSPATNFCTLFDLGASGTSFPYTYEVDYVKVWQLKQDCEQDKIICNLDPVSFDSKLYKSITIDGTNCSSVITNQSTLNFDATDYITLQEGFSIDASSNVFFDTIERCRKNLNTQARPAVPSEPLPPPPAFIERMNSY